MTGCPQNQGVRLYTPSMSLRAIVALAGAGVLGVALVTEHYAVVAGVLALYVLWMFVRDWIDRRQKYAGWTRIK